MLPQSCHALSEFLSQHPKEYQEWYENSNYIVVLSVRNELELKSLMEKVCLHGLIHSSFQEPDLNDELTAIAVAPSKAAKKLFSSLPLAMKESSKKQIGKEVVYE